MTLRQRLQLLLVAFFVLLAINAVLAAVTTHERDQVLAETARLERGREATQNLLSAAVDQQTGLRGFVITGNEQALEPFETGRRTESRELEVLRQLFADIPDLATDVDAAAAAAERWREEAAEPELEAVMQGDMTRAVRLVASGRSAQLFGELRNEIQDLRQNVTTHNHQLSRQLADARQRFNNLLFATFALGLLLLATTAVLLQRWVTIPLLRLSTDVRRVASGHLRERISSTGPPELARLGREAEQMRQRIVAELEAALRARQALEQHGPLVVTLRDHLRPRHDPLPEGLQSAGRFVPAEGVLAGDWYDLVPLAGERAALLLVDVSGHGPEAGVFALLAKQLLLAGLKEGRNAAETFAWVSDQLGDTGEVFLSGVVVEIDLDSGTGRYANAGHLPVLLASSGTIEELPPTGPILGPLSGEWHQLPLRLEPGALLIAYTDGVVEARNADGEEFGTERLLNLVTAWASEGASTLVEACEESVRSFTGGALRDDLTVVALGLTGVPAEERLVPDFG